MNDLGEYTFNYLVEEKHIDSEVLDKLIEDNGIYIQGVKKYDKYIYTRDGKSIKNKAICREYHLLMQNVHTKSDKLYVFENCISAISYVTLLKVCQNDWYNFNIISLNGASHKILNKFLRKNPHIKNIIFCINNDGLKKSALYRLVKVLNKENYKISIKYSILQTYNDDLKDISLYLEKYNLAFKTIELYLERLDFIKELMEIK